MLTGQAREIGDSVSAMFDNVSVQQVPEPSTIALLACAMPLLGWSVKRRRAARAWA